MVRNVLYVDDEAALCRAFERGLRGPGLRVVTTTSPPHAVELLDREPFDVVATDYRMPEINGIEILRLARQKRPGARRLLVSGRIEGEVAPEILDDADIDHVLIKPWSLDELRRVVRHAAEYAAVARELSERREREVALFTAALELRDPTTAREVAALALRLAERLELDGQDVARARRVIVAAEALVGADAEPDGPFIEALAKLRDS